MERILQERYRIIRPLGRGGLAAVYLCEDLRLPSKQWALKKMHSPEPELYDSFRETFEREAAILARLQHPCLPLIVDYFEQDRDAYLVMEYVEGENLSEYVRRRGPLAEAEAFRHGLMIADVLAFLHAQRPPLIFRDLKPENVMVTTHHSIKLIDFGLARRFVPGKRSDTVPSGSVGYAAPEQWEDLAQTDERSDIYSWGATVLNLASGKIPSPVFPLSVLRGMDPPLSEQGRAILSRCLKARPAERYADAVSLSRDVRRHLETFDDAVTDETAPALRGASAPQVQASEAPTLIDDIQAPFRASMGEATDRLGESRRQASDEAPQASDSEIPHGVSHASTNYQTCDAMGVSGHKEARGNESVRVITHGVSHASTNDQAYGAMGVSGHKEARGNESFRVTPVADTGYRRRSTDRAQAHPTATSVASTRTFETLRSAGLQFVLLIVATMAFVYALARALPITVAVSNREARPTQNHAGGVGPYEMHEATADTDLGRQLYSENRFEDAIAAFDRATTRVPDDAQAHILKENAYVRASGLPFLRVPFIGSLTGVEAIHTHSDMLGIALAQSIVNSRGGIRGRRILVDLYDDRSLTSQCLRVAEQLARNPDVLVVIGPPSSQNVLAVAPIFNYAHINLVSGAAAAQRVWEAGPYIFSAADTTDRRVHALARYVVSSGRRRVVVVVDRAGRLSHEMLADFKHEVQHDPVEVTEVAPFDQDTLSFAAQADAIKHLRPDAIFFADYRVHTVATFVAWMRADGIKTLICSQAIPFTPELVEVDPEDMNGMLIAGYFHPDIDTPAARAFMAAFRRKFGESTPTHLTVTNYDAFNAVVQGLQYTDPSGHGPTRESLNAFFRSSGVKRPAFEGVLGQFALGKRLNARRVWVMEVRNRRFRLLESTGDAAMHRAKPFLNTEDSR